MFEVSKQQPLGSTLLDYLPCLAVQPFLSAEEYYLLLVNSRHLRQHRPYGPRPCTYSSHGIPPRCFTFPTQIYGANVLQTDAQARSLTPSYSRPRVQSVSNCNDCSVWRNRLDDAMGRGSYWILQLEPSCLVKHSIINPSLCILYCDRTCARDISVKVHHRRIPFLILYMIIGVNYRWGNGGVPSIIFLRCCTSAPPPITGG